jgi:hypothetical protein
MVPWLARTAAVARPSSSTGGGKVARAAYRRVERAATWPAVALLLVAFLLCTAGFEWRRDRLLAEQWAERERVPPAERERVPPAERERVPPAERERVPPAERAARAGAPDGKGLDGDLGGYDGAEARDFLAGLGERGRRLYATTEVTLDLAFPLVYVTLLAVLIVRVYAERTAKYLVLLPALGGVADVLENCILAYLAWSFDGQASGWARVASAFTLLKSYALIATLVAIAVGAVSSVLATRRGDATPSRSG